MVYECQIITRYPFFAPFPGTLVLSPEVSVIALCQNATARFGTNRVQNRVHGIVKNESVWDCLNSDCNW